MTFHVGQKVVCIRDFTVHSDIIREWKINVPEKDKVYVIRELFLWNGQTGLKLIEVTNRPMLLTDGKVAEIGFNTEDFRPLVERKSQTDISFALDILDRVNGKVPERVQ